MLAACACVCALSLRVLERAGRDKADVLHRLAGEVGELVRLDNPILGVRWSE